MNRFEFAKMLEARDFSLIMLTREPGHNWDNVTVYRDEKTRKVTTYREFAQSAVIEQFELFDFNETKRRWENEGRKLRYYIENKKGRKAIQSALSDLIKEAETYADETQYRTVLFLKIANGNAKIDT